MQTTKGDRAHFRRIVTGHDSVGEAIITSDGPPPCTHLIGGPGGPTFIEVWNTSAMPVVIERQSNDPTEGDLVLSPPKGGTRLRVIDFPPESDAIRRLTAEGASAAFEEMGGNGASTHSKHSAHPLMHRTQTVDYGIVIEGELTLVLDHGETTIRAGDIVIQQGTNHAWANRSSAHCRVAFVLIDGRFVDDLQS